MEETIYNGFAKDFDLKRRKPWNSFEIYLKELQNKEYFFKGYTIDLGCANGRHFNALKNPRNQVIGIDNSIEFLKIAKKNIESKLEGTPENIANSSLILGDFRKLPLRTESIQNVFSIAAIHHIKYKEIREYTFRDIYNCLKPNGFFIFTLWKRWQKRYRFYFIKDWLNRKFHQKYRTQQINMDLKEFGDIIVPWTVSGANETYNRFYHLFSKHEAKKILKNFKIRDFKVFGGSRNKDNFFILTQK